MTIASLIVLGVAVSIGQLRRPAAYTRHLPPNERCSFSSSLHQTRSWSRREMLIEKQSKGAIKAINQDANSLLLAIVADKMVLLILKVC